MAAPPLYRYLPLESPSWMRILSLQPSKSRVDQLECRIRHIDRAKLVNRRDKDDNSVGKMIDEGFQNDEIRDYEAVSYAWGEGDFTEDLLVLPHKQISREHTAIKITAYVDEMLRNFRSRDDTIHLWIDAICLNQFNKLEIAQQIALMGKIYGQAQRARIWLGPEDGDVEKVFLFLETIHNATQVERIAEEVFGRLTHDPGHALEKFFSRSWFTRRWVVQEWALSQDAVMFAGNNHSVDHRAIERGINSLHLSYLCDNNALSHPKGRHAVGLLTTILWSEDNLLKRLFRHHRLECKLPRDRLLAYHGMFSKDLVWLAQVKRHGSESWMYNMTWQQFYMAMAQFYLEDGHSARQDLLYHVAAFGSLAEVDISLPSWCPDWSQSRKDGAESDLWWYKWYNNGPTTYCGPGADTGSFFDKDKTRLLAQEYAMRVQNCISGTKEQFLDKHDLEAMLRMFLSHAPLMDEQLGIKALCLLLAQRERHSLTAMTQPAVASLLAGWMDAIRTTNNCVEKWDGVLPEESVNAFYTLLPAVVAKYTIFNVEPRTIREFWGKVVTLYGIGLCNRQTCSQAVIPGDLVFMQTPDDLPHNRGQLVSPFVRRFTSDERLVLSGELSAMQLQALAYRGWIWDTDTAFVGRIGGAVSMVYFRDESLLSPPAAAGIQRYDIVIV